MSIVERGQSAPDLLDSRPDGPIAHRGGVATPFMLLASVCAISLLRNGVGVADLISFTAYWIFCLLVPGFVLHRLLVGLRPTLMEDMAFAALTGLALEISVWTVLSSFGLDEIVQWWWLVPWAAIAVGVARKHRVASVPMYERRSSAGWSWAISGISAISLIAIDVANFRAVPLPPTGGSTYQDMWWHLALIPESLRSGATEYPQIVGESFTYHLNAHAHVAIASRIARVAPEVVLFRLWVVPVVVATVVATAGLARQLTGKNWTGPLAAWVGLMSLVGGYLLTGQSVVSASPLTFLSPSQLIANPMIVAVTAGTAGLLRTSVTNTKVLWLILMAVAAAGTKTTVVPIMIGGSIVAWVAMITVHRKIPRRLTAVGMGFGVLAGWALVSSSSSAGSTVTLFGTLKSVSFYREISNDAALRVVNDAIYLDSLSTYVGARAAVISLSWFVLSHLPRLIGLGLLLDPRHRRDPVAWFIAGVVTAAWGATFVFDHVGASQLYFLHSISCLGGILTVWLLSERLAILRSEERNRFLSVGVSLGVVIAIVAGGVVSAQQRRGSAGPVEQFLAAVLVAAVVALAAAIVGVYFLKVPAQRAGSVVLVAAVLGVAVPPSLETASSQLSAWVASDPVASDPTNIDFVSTAEQEALLWLRSNSSDDDVLVTNLHCRPPTNSPIYCDARGFWVSGLSGRRVVLEGWAYTGQTQALQGLGGRSFATQLSPWPRRYELSEAIFEDPTPEVVNELVVEYGVRWAVYVERSGPISEAIEEFGVLRFENEGMRVYSLDPIEVESE